MNIDLEQLTDVTLNKIDKAKREALLDALHFAYFRGRDDYSREVWEILKPNKNNSEI